MNKLLKPSASMLIAVLALALAMVGTASAAPSAYKLTAGKVKKIAKAEIAKAAPTLVVAKATNATTADTATNANALGGRTLAQVTPVIAGAQNATVVNDITNAGTDVVTVNYTLAAASKVNFSGVTELDGDGSTNDEATCQIRNDNVGISLFFETAFDDIGTDNSADDVVLTSSASVAAGAHIATLRCTTLTGGPITKDDAALNIVAVPN
jgi:hypothetical protein